MPVVAIVVIGAVMGWLILAKRRPDDRDARSRAAHPTAPPASSVHIVHLGRED